MRQTSNFEELSSFLDSLKKNPRKIEGTTSELGKANSLPWSLGQVPVFTEFRVAQHWLPSSMIRMARQTTLDLRKFEGILNRYPTTEFCQSSQRS